jgi:cytochrome c biogenesis protein CcdA
MNDKAKKILIASIAVAVLAVFFFFAKQINPNALENLGLSIPLPLFTLIIGLIDGFNPCNLFVLTLLISLMLAESHERKRILAVGLTFVAVIYVFYFTFMAAWLNIFKYIGFVTPLRIAIALLALGAGLINMKELFFYRKGVTLMVQDKHVGPLKRRINAVATHMKKGSILTLIGAAAILAIFASLVELPCTAGFPIIYSSVLSGSGLETGFGHYAYLLLYNVFYVLPLLTIIFIFAFSFKGKQIDKKTMGIIKFIGGAIMFLLGLVLLFAPSVIGLG